MTSKRIYLSLIMTICVLSLVTFCAYSAEEIVSQGNVAVMNVEMPAMPSAGEAVSQPTAPVMNAEATVPAPVVNAEAPKAAEVQQAPEAKPAVEGSKEIKWVWGEVSSVDAATNKITIKYLNYDTDLEETLSIAIDSATRFENAEGINAVKVGDNVGVDYILNANGEALAKSIALEKAESMPEKTETEPAKAASEANVETPAAAPAVQEAMPAPQVNAVEAPVQK
jgi:hypothetical protein